MQTLALHIPNRLAANFTRDVRNRNKMMGCERDAYNVHSPRLTARNLGKLGLAYVYMLWAL